MMRFQTALSSALAAFLVVPVFLGQGQIASLEDALAGTVRALEVLKGVEKRLQEDPATAMSLILSATESPSGDEVQRDKRLEGLRNEVNLLQMELDALQSPVLDADGSVQSSLGARLPLTSFDSPLTPTPIAITTGLDDALRAQLAGEVEPRPPRLGEVLRTGSSTNGAERANAADGAAASAADAYTADPLKNGIACYRAGRYAEALGLLAPLDDGTGLYWRARTLERLERLDEAVQTMEHAIAKGGSGFDPSRAKTDLEFLRWKRDFVVSLPASRTKSAPAAKNTPKPPATEGKLPR
jgi:hypothetical protein